MKTRKTIRKKFLMLVEAKKLSSAMFNLDINTGKIPQIKVICSHIIKPMFIEKKHQQTDNHINWANG